MSFLFPAFLLGALAAAIPVVLHLMRREAAPEVPFTAVRLLRRSPPDATRRRRIRDPLLLAARVAALLLLAAAFARPYLGGRTVDVPLRIVAIDRSYSMGAPGRFDSALAIARGAIDATPRAGRVAVVAFDDRAVTLAAPGNAAEARAALDGLRAGYGGTRYAPLLARALELSEGAATTLIVVGDLQRAGWEDTDPVPVSTGLELELHDVGAVVSNTAVVDVRRVEEGVLASIQHRGDEPFAATARLLLDGQLVASAPVAGPASGSVDVTIPYALPDRGVLALELDGSDDPDGYPADNSRYLVLDAGAGTRVIVAGDGEHSGFYLSKALQAADPEDPGIDVRIMPPGALGRLAPEALSQTAVVMLLSTRSLDRSGREALGAFVRGGGGLFIAAAADVAPSLLATLMDWPDFPATEQAAGSAALAATDLRHPMFRAFGPLAANLGHVRFSRRWHVPAEGWEIAARFTDGAAALLERPHGKGRVLVFASDVDRRWNDFPVHPAFVPFVLESVRHLTEIAEARREYLVAESPPGAGPEPGVHVIGPNGRRVAVNVDIRESSPARVSEDEFRAMLPADLAPAARAPERLAQQTEARQNLWRYGLLLMLGVLIAESALGRMR